MARKVNQAAKKKAPVKAAGKASKSPVKNSPIPRDLKAKKTVSRNSAVPKSNPRGTAKPKSSAVASAATAVATPGAVTYDMIATRAYFISQSGSGGSEFENWLRAEWELRSGAV